MRVIQYGELVCVSLQLLDQVLYFSMFFKLQKQWSAEIEQAYKQRQVKDCRVRSLLYGDVQSTPFAFGFNSLVSQFGVGLIDLHAWLRLFLSGAIRGRMRWCIIIKDFVVFFRNRLKQNFGT